MKSHLKLVLTVLFVFLCISTNAQWLKKTESSDDLYKEAKKEIELKHYQKAINLCNKAIDISPKNLDLYLLLGRSYALAGKVDSARSQLNYVIQKNPKYKDAYIYLINIEVVACNYGQALEYADMGLKQFPNDRDILLKKLDIYNKSGDWIESNKLSEYIFDRFSSDAYVRSVYLDYKLTLARQYSHRGYIEIAKRAYESVLEQDPLNKEALQAVFALDVRSGNYESSLAYTNRALQSTPNSYEFLLKKVSILEAMGRYVDAIAVLDKLLKLYPTNPEVQKLNTYMRMEAGRHYMNTDPYLQFQAVLEREPANRDAMNYVVNIATARGLYNDALGFVNTALKRNPSDRELLIKKMSILEGLKKYGPASVIAERVYKGSPNKANKDNFLELRTMSAKQYMNDFEFDSAIADLKTVLFYDHGNMQATNYLISAYSQQKRYDDALRTIDEALTYYPGDERLLYKKAGVLESYQKYAEASQISRQLLQRYPNNRLYLISFVEQSLAAGRQSMQYDDFYGTLTILQEVLDKQPDNFDALNYIINIESSLKNYDSAIYYCDQALKYYPDNRDFLLKKAGVYADAKQFQDAYGVSGPLYANYPYNTKYRNAYIDHLIGSGRQYLGNDKLDSALIEFYRALDVAPNDTMPLYYALNVLVTQKEFDTALALIQRGRLLYPNNPFFLQKRAGIYEQQLKWEDAWRTADTLVKLTPGNEKNLDYMRYLFSRRLRNEIGIFYLRSKIMDTSTTALNSIATVQYSRRHSRGVITGRVNYAGRFIGTGFQYELETYFNLNPKWYLYGVGAYSANKVIFPTLRLGLSLFHVFNKGWEGEIGARYLEANGGTVLSGVASVGKEFNEMYFNLRGYAMNLTRTVDNSTALYYSVILTSRMYLNERKEYFTAIAGYGTAPDDFSQNYDLTRILRFNTISVGTGYTRSIMYRTTLGVFCSWYHVKTGEDLLGNETYRNQFDVYCTLLRRF